MNRITRITLASVAACAALGTAVVGGMVSGTVLAIFFVPLFFVIVRRLFDKRPKAATAPTQPHTDTPLLEGH